MVRAANRCGLLKYSIRLLQVHTNFRGQVVAIPVICAIMLAPTHAASLVDYHQHLFSPQSLSVFSAPRAITAADLVAQMDAAGINRAVVLSTAYGFSNPFKNPGPDEYTSVRAENDWISTQVAMYPRRLGDSAPSTRSAITPCKKLSVAR